MITLLELLHKLQDEKKNNLVNVDDWKFADVDHLKNMGFDFDGDYKLTLSDPEISVSQMKNQQGEYWVIEAEGKKNYFKKFDDVINFFDHYPQPEIDRQRGD